MGVIGGSLFNAVSGARHAPSGLSRRALGGMIRLKERAPVLGGQFAAWGLCFSSFDCTFAYLRQKEDPWNSIMSGAAAGAVMAARSEDKLILLTGAGPAKNYTQLYSRNPSKKMLQRLSGWGWAGS